MKRFSISLASFILAILLVAPMSMFAGNKQRAGSAGATQLLINPWARSSGFGNANAASIRGLESQYLNVAGTAFVTGTELIFVHTNWLAGADIGINAFGFSQKVSETGVLSLSVMSIDLGKIPITTVALPEGGIGTFHPVFTNIGLSYAKAFSNSIFGGMTLRIVNEGITDVKASGVAIDAGIHYVTGKNQQIKFGIALKNVGPTMKYSGDGLTVRADLPSELNMTVEQRSAEFELPSLMNISVSYDFIFNENNILQMAGTFTSNSFTKDQICLGSEYNFRNLILARVGYVYEEGVFDYETRETAFTGPTCGLSVQIPMNKEKGSVFAVEYSYRDTNPFNGVHSIQARVTL
ncbi:MAG: PorV/PorQ family protein [Bacteroidales bacterium]|nr:PorV/PorQ family protein [Bacteroidales bacterium]